MKKIILSLMAMAFAVAVQAGDAKTCQAKDKTAAGCCGEKMKTSTQAQGTCPFAAKATCTKQTAAKQKRTVKQVVLLSPKAMDLFH